MKKLLFSLVVFSVLFLTGCQEKMLNEPADSLLKHNDNLVTAKTLKLNYELSDPLYGSSKLSGTVSYVHTIINRTMNPIGLKEISLHIEMNSELYDYLGLMHLEWIVQGRSEEIYYVSEEGILLVEKSYWITNRNDVVMLVQYLVTTEGVGISSVSLVPLEK
jgi:hypothetical protein